MAAARGAEATVLLVGLDQSIESEDRDRRTIELPGVQKQLITQVAAGACPVRSMRLGEGKRIPRAGPACADAPLPTTVALFAVSRGPVVVVLIGGGAVDLAFAKDDDNVDAILFAGYPGEH
jgi:hypothetical protein